MISMETAANATVFILYLQFLLLRVSLILWHILEIF